MTGDVLSIVALNFARKNWLPNQNVLNHLLFFFFLICKYSCLNCTIVRRRHLQTSASYVLKATLCRCNISLSNPDTHMKQLNFCSWSIIWYHNTNCVIICIISNLLKEIKGAYVKSWESAELLMCKVSIILTQVSA